ncbi:hypothetical protein PanWU01x14_066110, partial [Parasponia andersonii]
DWRHREKIPTTKSSAHLGARGPHALLTMVKKVGPLFVNDAPMNAPPLCSLPV